MRFLLRLKQPRSSGAERLSRSRDFWRLPPQAFVDCFFVFFVFFVVKYFGGLTSAIQYDFWLRLREIAGQFFSSAGEDAREPIVRTGIPA